MKMYMTIALHINMKQICLSLHTFPDLKKKKKKKKKKLFKKQGIANKQCLLDI